MKFRIEPTLMIGRWRLLVQEKDHWRTITESHDVYLLEQAAQEYKTNVDRLERWSGASFKEFEL